MPERVKLVYIINTLGVGGAEVGMCRLLDGLDEEKYDVTVVALDGQSTGIEDRVPDWATVIRLRHSSGNFLSSGWKFLRAVRGADIIVGSLFHSAMVAKLAGVVNPDAIVSTWRHSNSFKTQKRRTIFNLTSYLTDVVLADSEAVAKTLLEETDIDSSLVHTVPIAGINLSDYPVVTQEATDAAVVGTVGRLAEPKNPFTILDVAEQLQEANIKFEIAGDGELRDQLEEEIQHRQITNVTLRGLVEDVPGFLSNLDIYFQPSKREGLCITVIEAMATGLPVVGSDVGGIGENVKHGESGFLYDSTNTDAFASTIQDLAQNRRRRAKLGKTGRETVEELFTQTNLVSEFEKATEKTR
ncbi:glycosyltransferase family 4 protein [Halolamina rubra]|uniref:glycosyltransferase family 4 protein n=1 Tax=Halolamina rubra TaxID=1380430 RepID=UPI0009E5376F|nr:glycosyltransferase family 4 protein [Halolamina rubra]